MISAERNTAEIMKMKRLYESVICKYIKMAEMWWRRREKSVDTEMTQWNAETMA